MNCVDGGCDDRIYSISLENLSVCSHLYADNKKSNGLRYYCKLTDKHCVADKISIIQRLLDLEGHASINKKILNRCPSREEISDVVEAKGDLY